jgi:hypothetical protein
MSEETMSNHFNLEDIQDGAERIVSFTLAEDRKIIRVAEECDWYFTADLTRAEVRKLIDRLESLYEQMDETRTSV